MDFNTPKEVIDRIIELRHDHASLRAIVAKLTVLGQAYATGSHWKKLRHNPHAGTSSVVEWNEDWDDQESQFQVTDNRIGPVVRRIGASTNATRVEASVKPRAHHRGPEWQGIAGSSELALNGIEEIARYTPAYRAASALRWEAGSALVILRKMRSPDGNGEQWLRWEHAPLSDLIWDVSNVSGDLRDHQELILEQSMTIHKFRQIHGDPAQYGIDVDRLPKMRDMAGHYIAAAEISGSGLFDAYARQSQTPAIRYITYLVADKSIPGRWSKCYHIADTSVFSGSSSSIRGTILNWDDPTNEFGGDGLSIAKIDAFKRRDAVMAMGLPHVMSSSQDLLNITRSIHFRQMVAFLHGQWMADRTTIDEDEFTQRLADGGLLTYDSHGGQKTPPQPIRPPSADHQMVNIIEGLGQNMLDQSHLSPLNLGLGKSHVPHSTNEMLLRESAVVIDNVVSADVDELSSLMRTTLGTLRGVLPMSESVLRRLHDEHGFMEADLQNIAMLDPISVPLLVRVREHSIIVRGTDERVMELDKALMIGQLTPVQHAIAMSEELQRPLNRSLMKEIEFCRNAVRRIIEGHDWTGLPSLDFEVFARLAQDAIFGLDMETPESLETIARLEEAIQVQQKIAEENPILQRPQVALNSQGGQPGQPQGGAEPQLPEAAMQGLGQGLPAGMVPSFS